MKNLRRIYMLLHTSSSGPSLIQLSIREARKSSVQNLNDSSEDLNLSVGKILTFTKVSKSDHRFAK